jgi:hypothetical protein
VFFVHLHNRRAVLVIYRIAQQTRSARQNVRYLHIAVVTHNRVVLALAGFGVAGVDCAGVLVVTCLELEYALAANALVSRAGIAVVAFPWRKDALAVLARGLLAGIVDLTISRQLTAVLDGHERALASGCIAGIAGATEQGSSTEDAP